MKYGTSLLALVGASVHCILATAAPQSASSRKHAANQQFMRAMSGKPESVKQLKQANLNQRILSKARRLDEANNADDADEDADGGNNNGYYYDGNWYNEDYDGDYDMINLSNFAFKYSGCSSVQEFDDEAAEDANEYGGGPIVTTSYAVFSLCPIETCNAYTVIGCGSNYGEYLIKMEDYLEALAEYYEERFNEYCEYCEVCSDAVQYEGFYNLQTCFQEKYEEQLEDIAENGDSGYQYSDYAGNYASSNYNRYNSNTNYNNAANYDSYMNYNNDDGDADADANDGNRARRQRKLQNDGNNAGYNNYNNQEAIEMAMAAYGYYDEDGVWVAGSSDAMAELQATYNYMSPGVYGSDGQWYPADYDSECMQEFMEESYCSDDMATTCGDYNTYCYDADNDNNNNNGNQNQYNLNEISECTEFQNQYGNVYYLAPTCGYDHFTITLGVFADEDCRTFSSTSLSQVLGQTVDADSVFYHPKECIYCDGSDGFSEDYQEYQYQNGQNEEEEQAEEEAGVIEMCQRLYEEAGTCNVNLEAWQDMQKTDSQITREETTCAYIEQIRSGSYTEEGQVIVSSASFDLADWRNLEQYQNMGLFEYEVVGLVFSILLVLSLLIAVSCTQRALNRVETPWRPKFGSDLISISRQSSGIGMARSRSGPGNTPLI